MNMKLILTFFIFIISLNLSAQKVFENSAISEIVTDENGNINFYQKLKNGLFNEVLLDIDFADEEKNFKYEFEIQTNEKKYSDIVSENDIYLDVNDIVPLSLENLTKQLKTKCFTTIDAKTRNTTFLAHQAFFLNVDYDLENEEFKKYLKKPFGDFKKTYPKMTNYYFIHLGNNRYITVLDKNDAFVYNTKKGLKMVGKSNLKFQTINKNPINFNDLSDLSNPEKFWLIPSENYFIKKTSSGKSVLKNVYDDLVLPLEYDSIELFHHFFIGKISNNFKIYNSYLKPINLENVKSAFTYHEGLEIIQNNELKIYDINGKTIKKYKPYFIYNMGCGTHSYSQTLELKQDKLHDNAHYLKITKDIYGFKIIQKDFIIKNIPTTAAIKFSDNTNQQTKSDMFGSVSTNLIIARENERFGLYTIVDCCRIDNENEIANKEKLNENYKQETVFLPKSDIKITEMLPINYDSIYFNQNRIYFTKNGLTGIYGITNDVEFSEYKQKTNNFYRITQSNGKKGWLNCQEKKVLWDD